MPGIRSDDVFLSFKDLNPDGSRTQASFFAENLYRKLALDRYSVFFSRSVLHGAESKDCWDIIKSSLESSRVLVSIFDSPEQLTSGKIPDEWQYFLEHDKDIIPVRIDGGTLADDAIPEGLRIKQGFEIDHASKNSDSQVVELLKKIGELLRQNSKETSSAETVPSTIICQFCGAPISYWGGQACVRCVECGLFTGYTLGRSYLRKLESAYLQRDGHDFSEAVRSFESIETLYHDYQAVFGRMLASVSAVLVPGGGGDEVEKQITLFAEPREKTVELIRRTQKIVIERPGIPSEELADYQRIINRLLDITEYYLKKEKKTKWDIILCCASADEEVLKDKKEAFMTLESWGYKVFDIDDSTRDVLPAYRDCRLMSAYASAQVMLFVGMGSELLGERVTSAFERFSKFSDDPSLIFLLSGGEIDRNDFLDMYGGDIPASDVLNWSEDSVELFEQLKSVCVPEAAVCSHNGLFIGAYNTAMRRSYRYCVKCGACEDTAYCLSGEKTGSVIHMICEDIKGCGFADALRHIPEAVKLFEREKNDAERDGDNDRREYLLEQVRLLAFLNYQSELGMRIYRTGRGWYTSISASSFPALDKLADKKTKLICSGEELKDIVNESYDAACGIIKLLPIIPQYDVLIHYRTEADGGYGTASEFSDKLAEYLRELGLKVCCLYRGSISTYWDVPADSRSSAAYTSALTVVVTVGTQDIVSAEIMAQVDPVPVERVLYVELESGAASGHGNVLKVQNVDDANARSAADKIRDAYKKFCMKRLVELSREFESRIIELKWYSERGTEISTGTDRGDFLFRAASLYMYKKAGFYDPARAIPMIKEAARLGSREAVAYCQRNKISY